MAQAEKGLIHFVGKPNQFRLDEGFGSSIRGLIKWRGALFLKTAPPTPFSSTGGIASCGSENSQLDGLQINQGKSTQKWTPLLADPILE